MQLYRWRWRAKLPERHGQLFIVLARGTMNSCLIEFIDDGWQCVTSRFALRKATGVVEQPHQAPIAPKPVS